MLQYNHMVDLKLYKLAKLMITLHVTEVVEWNEIYHAIKFDIGRDQLIKTI